jgi:hypothetical protein
MMRFMEMGVPVINLTNMTVLAKEFGMPKDPVVIPAPGEGSLFYDEQYNPLLAASILAFIAICLFSILMLNKKKFYLENAIMEPVEV